MMFRLKWVFLADVARHIEENIEDPLDALGFPLVAIVFMALFSTAVPTAYSIHPVLAGAPVAFLFAIAYLFVVYTTAAVVYYRATPQEVWYP